MPVEFSNEAALTLEQIERTSPKVHERIWNLIFSIQETPTKGIGKPEPLKFHLSGLWSRRIDSKNRLVYRFDKKSILIVSLTGHYGDK